MDVDEGNVNLVSELNMVRTFRPASTVHERRNIHEFLELTETECWLLLASRSSRQYRTIIITITALHGMVWSNAPFFVSNLQISKEGDSFAVPVAVAKMSELVKSMMDGTFGK